jgi:hypothetical protein
MILKSVICFEILSAGARSLLQVLISGITSLYIYLIFWRLMFSRFSNVASLSYNFSLTGIFLSSSKILKLSHKTKISLRPRSSINWQKSTSCYILFLGASSMLMPLISAALSRYSKNSLKSSCFFYDPYFIWSAFRIIFFQSSSSTFTSLSIGSYKWLCLSTDAQYRQ